jgi:hypothetical protein
MPCRMVVALLSIIGGATLLSTGVLGVTWSAYGGLSILIAIASAVVLYWLWQMKKQGWMWAMVLEGVSLLLALFQMSAWGVIIPAVVLIYLWMNKKLFK